MKCSACWGWAVKKDHPKTHPSSSNHSAVVFSMVQVFSAGLISMNHVLQGCTLEAVQRVPSLKNSVLSCPTEKYKKKKRLSSSSFKLCPVKSLFCRLQGCLIFHHFFCWFSTLPQSLSPLTPSSTLAILPVQTRSHSPRGKAAADCFLVFRETTLEPCLVIPKKTTVS